MRRAIIKTICTVVFGILFIIAWKIAGFEFVVILGMSMVMAGIVFLELKLGGFEV